MNPSTTPRTPVADGCAGAVTGAEAITGAEVVDGAQAATGTRAATRAEAVGGTGTERHLRLTPLQPWIAGLIGRPGPDLDPQDLRGYQLARLRHTIEFARARAPFVRDLFAAATGLPRDGLPASLADLARFPFSTPADLTAHGSRMVCVGQDEITRIVTLDTSGTTGAPKRVWFTRADQDLTVDFFRVGMSTFTAPGDRVLILLPCERPGGVGDLLATAMMRLGAEPVRHSVVRDLDAALAVLHSPGVDVAVGVPAQVLALARADPSVRLRAVLLSTDHVPRAVVRAIEDAWGCTVFGHYGMTETGLGGGVECAARRGYHLREADLYVEIVDPDGGDPVPDGREGEVVLTTLTRTGMPLIRYRTGDLGRFLSGPCPCGTTLRTLERITRRVDGVVRLAGAGVFALADLDEALYALDDVVDLEAALHRGSGRDRDRLEVTVRVTGPAAVPATRTAALAAVAAIPAVARSRTAGALDLVVDAVPVSGVPGPAKRRLRIVPDPDRPPEPSLPS